MEEREIELIDYLRVLWRQKWVIVVTFVAAVLTAWLLSWMVSPIYEVKTNLLLLPPLASELGAEAAGSTLAPEAYQQLAVSTEILQAVIEDAPLPRETEIDAFRDRLKVSVKSLSESPEGPQLLLNVTVTGTEPEELPAIAEVWTKAFTEKFGELFQDRTARSYDYVNQNYAETEAALQHVLEGRKDFLLEYPVDLLQAEVAALQVLLAANGARLVTARQELRAQQARLSALETELAEQPPTLVLERDLDPEALISVLASGLSPREYEALLELRVQHETLNSTYESLNTEIAFERANVRQLEAEIGALEQSTVETRAESEVKERELTETQAAVDDFDWQIDLLKAAQAKLATKLQDAKIALAETPDPIRVIDEPLAPRYPIAPKRTTNIAIAGFLGLIVGTLLAFFVDYITRAQHDKRRATVKVEPRVLKPNRGDSNDYSRPSGTEGKEESQQ